MNEKELTTEEILANRNHAFCTLLGMATSIIQQSNSPAKEWWLNAIQEVVYKNNPIPPLPEPPNVENK